jgi:hypothetical protein
MVVPSTDISPHISYISARPKPRLLLTTLFADHNETNSIYRALSKIFPKIIEEFKGGFLVCEAGQIITVRLPPATINISLLQRAQTGFEVHPASSSVVIGGCYCRS